jgi:ATP-binding cassette subfamily C (CFTR/MRP) protein 1
VYWTKVSSLDVQHEAHCRFSLFASSIASLGLGLLLFLEQRRPHRISDLATQYLLVSVLCDVVYLTIPSDIAGHATLSRPVLLRCYMQSTLLILEYGTQCPALEVFSRHQSPQELHGLFSRLLFLWINPILLQGCKDIFTQADMPPLNQDMMPESTRKAMVEIWSQRGQRRAPQNRLSFCFSLVE